ncbi:MAG: DUF6498-containing protein [Halococcoides sp.]
MDWPSRGSSWRSLGVLVGANVVSLVGALWWGWYPYDLLVFYWIETAVVGIVTVPKIVLAKGPFDPRSSQGGTPLSELSRRQAILRVVVSFLVVHWIIWAITGVFVVFLAESFGSPSAHWQTTRFLALAIGTMAVAHGSSFGWSYVGREQYRTASPDWVALRSWKHIGILYGTMLAAAPIAMIVHNRLLMLALFVVVKIVFDVLVAIAENPANSSN